MDHPPAFHPFVAGHDEHGIHHRIEHMISTHQIDQPLRIVEQAKTPVPAVALTKRPARGKSLKNNDLPLFDTFKQHIESNVESALIYGMHNCYKADEHTSVIAFAEALFEIDPFNEEALAMLIKAMNRMKLTEEAKKRYYLFITEYKKSYGVEFGKPYNFFG